uniref:TPR_REGION domain-containing protein n=1 Tax=Strongyloides papillosus TaxID=174720 RepID=A0A0N5BSV4_STREA
MPTQPSEVLRLQGNKYFSQKKYYNALKCYTEALEEDPTNVLALSNRSQTLINLGSFDLAYIDAEKAYSLSPDNDKTKYRLVTSLYKMGLEKFSKDGANKLGVDWKLVTSKEIDDKDFDVDVPINHTLKLEDTQVSEPLQIIKF